MYCMSSDDVKTAFPTSLPRLFAREVSTVHGVCVCGVCVCVCVCGV